MTNASPWLAHEQSLTTLNTFARCAQTSSSTTSPRSRHWALMRSTQRTTAQPLIPDMTELTHGRARKILHAAELIRGATISVPWEPSSIVVHLGAGIQSFRGHLLRAAVPGTKHQSRHYRGPHWLPAGIPPSRR